MMPARISPAASLPFPALSSGAITLASKWMTLVSFRPQPNGGVGEGLVLGG
jgi:hypothetical protein